MSVAGSESSLPIFLVDAFASKQFQGNPAGVCLLLNEVLTDSQMLHIAKEMNQSETAFVSPVNSTENFQSGTNFNLRWFTPTNEVNLCGHATLATSAVIFEKSGNVNEKLTFHTLSGELIVRKSDGNLVMDFPLNETVKQDPSDVIELIKLSIGELKPQDIQYAPKPHSDLVIRLPDTSSRKDLEQLKPDTTAMMKAYPGGRIRGVLVTLKGQCDNGAVDECGEHFDFMSRYFAPWNGIPEDPVTGSAHTVLASYWSKQCNKDKLYGRQCSERGGNVRMTVNGSRVDLAGKAVVVLEGKINLK